MNRIISVIGNNNIIHKKCVEILVKQYPSVYVNSVSNELDISLVLNNSLNIIKSDLLETSNYLNIIKKSTGIIHIVDDEQIQLESANRIYHLKIPSAKFVLITDETITPIKNAITIKYGRIDSSVSRPWEIPINVFSNIKNMLSVKEFRNLMFDPKYNVYLDTLCYFAIAGALGDLAIRSYNSEDINKFKI
jgi:hypothetical protein